MSYWIRATVYQAIYGIPLQTDWDFRTVTEPTSTALAAFLIEFGNDVIQVMNGIQADTIVNVQARAVWRGNTAVQAEANLTDGGTVVVTDAIEQVSSASIAFKKFVDDSRDFDDEPYTEGIRQIGHGYVFIPGASDDWIEGGRSTIPGGLVSAVEAMETAIGATISAGAVDYIPIVHGFALPAQVTPTVRPARPEVYADVINSTFKWVTWHESRQRNTFR